MMNINREIRGLQTIQLLCGVETIVYADSILGGIGFDISKKILINISMEREGLKRIRMKSWSP